MKAPAGMEKLTKRELEIMLMYGRGIRFNEISRRLERSKKTIATHKANTVRKLKIRPASYGRVAFQLAVSRIRGMK